MIHPRFLAFAATAALLGGCATHPTTPAPATSEAAPAASADASPESLAARTAFFVQHARKGECGEVKAGLDAGIPVDAVDSLDQTALIAAASKNEVACAKLLVDRGADVNKADNGGWTPLIHATYFGASAEMLSLLLDRGAAINAQNDRGVTALYFASATGHVEQVQLLLSRGADRSIATRSGYTPLRVAQLKGIVPVVALLDPAAAKTSAAAPKTP